MKSSRFLPVKYRKVIDKVTQHNSYYCQPENLLLGIIADNSRVIRQLELRRILKARSSVNKSLGKFVLPKILMEASNHHSKIDWQQCNLIEPPLTMDVSSECLHFCLPYQADMVTIRKPYASSWVNDTANEGYFSGSCWSQLHKKRDRLIRSRIEGKKRLLNHNTKKDFHSRYVTRLIKVIQQW